MVVADAARAWQVPGQLLALLHFITAPGEPFRLQRLFHTCGQRVESPLGAWFEHGPSDCARYYPAILRLK